MVENDVKDASAIAPLGELWRPLVAAPDAFVARDSLLVLLVSFPPPGFVDAPPSLPAGEGVELVEGELDGAFVPPALPPFVSSADRVAAALEEGGCVEALDRVPVRLLDPPADMASTSAPAAVVVVVVA